MPTRRQLEISSRPLLRAAPDGATATLCQAERPDCSFGRVGSTKRGSAPRDESWYLDRWRDDPARHARHETLSITRKRQLLALAGWGPCRQLWRLSHDPDEPNIGGRGRAIRVPPSFAQVHALSEEG